MLNQLVLGRSMFALSHVDLTAAAESRCARRGAFGRAARRCLDAPRHLISRVSAISRLRLVTGTPATGGS